MNFFELKGHKIKNIDIGDESFIIETDKGKYQACHYQDCCEQVRIEKVIGDPAKLIGKKITLAQDDNPNSPDWYAKYYNDSYTWTAFYLETGNGKSKNRLEIWFLGESNGYYGESVDFNKIS